MDKAQLIEDYKVMVKADTEHLLKAAAAGDNTIAREYLESILWHVRELHNMGVKDVELN